MCPRFVPSTRGLQYRDIRLEIRSDKKYTHRILCYLFCQFSVPCGQKLHQNNMLLFSDFCSIIYNVCVYRVFYASVGVSNAGTNNMPQVAQELVRWYSGQLNWQIGPANNFVERFGFVRDNHHCTYRNLLPFDGVMRG